MLRCVCTSDACKPKGCGTTLASIVAAAPSAPSAPPTAAGGKESGGQGVSEAVGCSQHHHRLSARGPYVFDYLIEWLHSNEERRCSKVSICSCTGWIHRNKNLSRLSSPPSPSLHRLAYLSALSVNFLNNEGAQRGMPSLFSHRHSSLTLLKTLIHRFSRLYKSVIHPDACLRAVSCWAAPISRMRRGASN